MSFDWKPDKRGVVIEHKRGRYRIEPKGSQHLVFWNDRKIGSSTSIDLAREMAERHAETGSSAPKR